MSAWAWVPLIAALLTPLTGPRIVRLLPPAAAVRLATTAAVTIAGTTALVLAIAADLTLTRLEAITRAEFTPGVPRPSVVSLAVGAAAAMALALLVAAAGRCLLRSVRQLVRAFRDARSLGDPRSGLVVVKDATPAAFAVTGYPGRVVVSTAMLQALTARERQALLAHENAHLRHHHQIYVQLAALAAAANPLLRPLAATVSSNTERWADESAAEEVGDRQLAARAVARAALASHAHPDSSVRQQRAGRSAHGPASQSSRTGSIGCWSHRLERRTAWWRWCWLPPSDARPQVAPPRSSGTRRSRGSSQPP